MSDKLKDVPIILGAVGTVWSKAADLLTLTNFVGVATLLYTALRIFEWFERRWKKGKKE